MVKIHKRLISIFIVFVFIFVLSGCSMSQAPKEYKNYVCYDYHLVALKTSGIEKVATVQKDHEWSGTHTVRFKKISGETDEQFVFAKLRPTVPFSMFDQILVLQNPDNYVDPWQDWTVEKIEFGYIQRTLKDEDVEDYVAMKDVLFSTSDVDCISELKDFIFNAEVVDADPKGYELEYDVVGNDKEEFCIRVYFEESKNIVWVSEIKSFYSAAIDDRIIYLDKGKTPTKGVERNEKFADVSEYENLYNWIFQSIAGTNSNNNSF